MASISFSITPYSMGFILVASNEQRVCAIFLGDDKTLLYQEFQQRFPHQNLVEGHDQEFLAKITAFVETPCSDANFPLLIEGTTFQQRVWQALRNIPMGTTVSYSEIAKQMGAPKAVRAVARACAMNKLAVVIPCHRVIKQDGTLSGYRWGIERKRALLASESKRIG